MAETETFSRSELVRIAGVDDDAVAFWLRSNLLIPEGRGARKHRRFTRREVKIAAVLGQLRSIGLNVSAMAGLVSELRRAQAVYDQLSSDLGGDRWMAVTASGHDPSASNLSVLVELGYMTTDERALVESLQKTMTEEIERQVMLADNFEGEPAQVHLACVAKNENGQWRWIGSPEGGYMDASVGIVLNLARILELTWPEASDAGAE